MVDGVDCDPEDFDVPFPVTLGEFNTIEEADEHLHELTGQSMFGGD